MAQKAKSERASRSARRQHLFRLPTVGTFLLAAVREGDRFSVVTTAPNASVSSVHDRMPLVLGPRESGVWLESGFAGLADRNRVTLLSRPIT